MKILVIFIFVTLLPGFQGAGTVGYMKILKVVVKHTGTRCRGFFLKLKPVTRYETLVDAGCEELMRPITDGFVNLRVSAKTASMQNFRHIITLNNLEPCVITADRKKFPALNYFFDRAKGLYPEFVHLCPYTEIKMYNISLKFMQNPSENDMNFIKAFNLVMPNAVYKFHADAWDSTGDRVNVTAWVEAKYKKRNTQDLSDL